MTITARRVVRRYLDALAAGDGAGAAALFTPDGVIDDYRGGHHVGRAAIEAFIGRPRDIRVEGPLNVLEEGSRVTVYGRVHYADGDVAPLRWVFHFADELIEHLGNSRVSTLHGVA